MNLTLKIIRYHKSNFIFYGEKLTFGRQKPTQKQENKTLIFT